MVMNENKTGVLFGTKQRALITAPEGFEVESVIVYNKKTLQPIPCDLQKHPEHPNKWECTFTQPSADVAIKPNLRLALYSIFIEAPIDCEVVLVEEGSGADIEIQTVVGSDDSSDEPSSANDNSSDGNGSGEQSQGAHEDHSTFNCPQHSLDEDAGEALSVGETERASVEQSAEHDDEEAIGNNPESTDAVEQAVVPPSEDGATEDSLDPLSEESDDTPLADATPCDASVEEGSAPSDEDDNVEHVVATEDDEAYFEPEHCDVSDEVNSVPDGDPQPAGVGSSVDSGDPTGTFDEEDNPRVSPSFMCESDVEMPEEDNEEDEGANDVVYDCGKYSEMLAHKEPIRMTQSEIDEKNKVFWMWRDRYTAGRCPEEKFEEIKRKHAEFYDALTTGLIQIVDDTEA